MIDSSIIGNNPFLLSEEKMNILIEKRKIALQVTSTDIDDNELDCQKSCSMISWVKLHWDSVTNLERALLRPDAYDCCHNWSDTTKKYEFDGYIIWVGSLLNAPKYIQTIYNNTNDKGHGAMCDEYIEIVDDNDTWNGYNSGWLKQLNITISFNKKFLYKCCNIYLPVVANAHTLSHCSTILNNNKKQYNIIYKEYYNRIQLIQDNFFPWNASFTIHNIISAYNNNCVCWDVDPFYWTYNHYKFFDGYNSESNKYLDLKAKYYEKDNVIYIDITSDIFEKLDKVQMFWKWIENMYKLDSIISISNNSIYYKKDD